MSLEVGATLNLSKLLRREPSGDEVEGQGDFLPDASWHSHELHFSGPLHYELVVRRMGGDHDDFVLSGSVSGDVTMPCRRCLEPRALASRSSFLYGMRFDSDVSGLVLDDSNEEEVLVFGQAEVDFAEFLAQVFIVDLPLTTVCEDETQCQDLVKIYGQATPQTQKENARDSAWLTALEELQLES